MYKHVSNIRTLLLPHNTITSIHINLNMHKQAILFSFSFYRENTNLPALFIHLSTLSPSFFLSFFSISWLFSTCSRTFSTHTQYRCCFLPLWRYLYGTPPHPLLTHTCAVYAHFQFAGISLCFAGCGHCYCCFFSTTSLAFYTLTKVIMTFHTLRKKHFFRCQK